MWVPPEEKDPVLPHAPTRQSVACFGAVGLRTGKFAYAFSPVFNADEFEKFLRLLLRRRSPGRRMVVVLDNARYHHARKLRPFLDEQADRLELLFLPPYSPHLAPIERVWKRTRQLAVHNLYSKDLDKLVATVESCFLRWKKPNSVLRSLCGITYVVMFTSPRKAPKCRRASPVPPNPSVGAACNPIESV